MEDDFSSAENILTGAFFSRERRILNILTRKATVFKISTFTAVSTFIRSFFLFQFDRKLLHKNSLATTKMPTIYCGSGGVSRLTAAVTAAVAKNRQAAKYM